MHFMIKLFAAINMSMSPMGVKCASTGNTLALIEVLGFFWRAVLVMVVSVP